jgi:hypothetical protein
MTMKIETAKIYRFPAGGRDALKARKAVRAPELAADLSDVAFGGSWYHEEAISESKPVAHKR